MLEVSAYESHHFIISSTTCVPRTRGSSNTGVLLLFEGVCAPRRCPMGPLGWTRVVIKLVKCGGTFGGLGTVSGVAG
jgi:hypothetical protein